MIFHCLAVSTVKMWSDCGVKHLKVKIQSFGKSAGNVCSWNTSMLPSVKHVSGSFWFSVGSYFSFRFWWWSNVWFIFFFLSRLIEIFFSEGIWDKTSQNGPPKASLFQFGSLFSTTCLFVVIEDLLIPMGVEACCFRGFLCFLGRVIHIRSLETNGYWFDNFDNKTSS